MRGDDWLSFTYRCGVGRSHTSKRRIARLKEASNEAYGWLVLRTRFGRTTCVRLSLVVEKSYHVECIPSIPPGRTVIDASERRSTAWVSLYLSPQKPNSLTS